MSLAQSARVALGVLLLAAFALSVCAIARHRDTAVERQSEEQLSDAVFDRTAVGDPDTRVDELAGFQGRVIRESGWPAVAGDLDGYENGADIDLNFTGPPYQRVRVGPRDKITWVVWEFPRSGRWIAVATLGERFARGFKSAVIVAVRKNF
jgi:hypothetical protein